MLGVHVTCPGGGGGGGGNTSRPLLPTSSAYPPSPTSTINKLSITSCGDKV